MQRRVASFEAERKYLVELQAPDAEFLVRTGLRLGTGDHHATVAYRDVDAGSVDVGRCRERTIRSSAVAESSVERSVPVQARYGEVVRRDR